MIEIPQIAMGLHVDCKILEYLVCMYVSEDLPYPRHNQQDKQLAVPQQHLAACMYIGIPLKQAQSTYRLAQNQAFFPPHETATWTAHQPQVQGHDATMIAVAPPLGPPRASSRNSIQLPAVSLHHHHTLPTLTIIPTYARNAAVQWLGVSYSP